MIQRQVAKRDVEMAKIMEVGTSSVREMGKPGDEKDSARSAPPEDRRGNKRSPK